MIIYFALRDLLTGFAAYVVTIMTNVLVSQPNIPKQDLAKATDLASLLYIV
jgi:hypothetical protein